MSKSLFFHFAMYSERADMKFFAQIRGKKIEAPLQREKNVIG